MFDGWLAVNGQEVVNTHRAHRYATKAGLAWVKGCDSCGSITAAHGEDYVTPMVDNDNGQPPPWWGDGSNLDALEFLGVVGVQVQNVDDATRSIQTIARAGGGGFIGSLSYLMRTITVRALLVAASDCALGYGLEWLRSIDTDQTCANGYVQMYDCCPALTSGDCEDPACLGACVDPRLRTFYDARITQGPTVLRRRTMSRGAMAEVEFIVTCGDPGIYSPAGLLPMSLESTSLVEVAARSASPEPVDVFAVPSPYAAPAAAPQRERTLPARARWRRQEAVLDRPAYGTEVTVEVALSPSSHTEDVRVTLMRDGEQVMAARIPAIPMGGSVRLDQRQRRVFTTSHGVERVNGALVRSADGDRFVWPKPLPNAGEYTLAVDRAAGEPLLVEAALHGRAAP